MPSLADLIRMGKQYVSDALPGGSLNPEVNRQGILDGAALSTTAVPVLGDLLGLGADLNRYATDPESRTAGNFALSGLGLLPFVPAMTAWHGSPHKFDKFSLDKIGTGEGAQAYGHGLYLAEHPEVATQYSKMFDKNQVPATQLQKLRDAAPKGSAEWSHYDDLMKTGIQGSLYKTDIPDEAVARFLDWDKPLSQQAPEVRSALNKTGLFNGSDDTAAFHRWMKKEYPGFADDWGVLNAKQQAGFMQDYVDSTGASFPNTQNMSGEKDAGVKAYQSLQSKYGPQGLADYLRNNGVPGIRYLDGGSRGRTGGELIDVSQKNGQWFSKIRKDGSKISGQIGDVIPQGSMFTTSMPFKTESEARQWAQQQINGGTSNFVAFDPELIRILERNGIPTGNQPWKPGEWQGMLSGTK